MESLRYLHVTSVSPVAGSFYKFILLAMCGVSTTHIKLYSPLVDSWEIPSLRLLGTDWDSIQPELFLELPTMALEKATEARNLSNLPLLISPEAVHKTQ